MALTTILRLRISKKLHRKAAEIARRNGINLSQLVRYLLARLASGEFSLDVSTNRHRELMATLGEEIEILWASLASKE